MLIQLCYITVTNGIKTLEFASRFVGSLIQCPPFEIQNPNHSIGLVVVCNGGPPSHEVGSIFQTLTIPHAFLMRPNDGSWDLGAYIEASSSFGADMLVCLGESCYFHRPGWLTRFVDAWYHFGKGMYGFWASNLIRPHLNTTGFVIDPKLLKNERVPRNKTERYAFEHGTNAFWKRMNILGKPTKLVTWDGVWDPHQWRLPKNILWRGTQENCLAYCSHTDRFNAADPEKKAVWSRHADRFHS